VTLEAFICRLEQAGFDLDAEQVLDALWLASLGCDLSLHNAHAGAPPARSAEEAVQRKSARGHDRSEAVTGRQANRNEGEVRDRLDRRTEQSSRTPVFPRGRVAPGTSTRRAAPVTLPAPQPLPDRLELMRALKPLAQRWPSRQYADLDEERTVEACADMAAAGLKLMLPVMRPRQERWFNVELVLEDDAAIALWEETLGEFARMLAETGAFGQVRQWRLRMPREGEALPYLENAIGARTPATALMGQAERRLIVFASQGTSAHWSDGSYGAILGPWLRDNAVVLLHLTPPERWARSLLGEPHGTASTSLAGAPAAILHMHTQWWRLPNGALTPTSLPLPVVVLAPGSMAQWAKMQMARGPGHPAYLLETAQTAPGQAGTPRARVPNIERALSLLKYESPDSFRLAVLLSSSSFTLMVARLIQSIAFYGNTDPSLLAELMRNNLVVANDGSKAVADDVYYALQPEAREILQRSLRDADATELGRQIQRELSRQLERLGATDARSTHFMLDEEGGYDLPAWAQPFASVANALLGLPVDTDAAAQRVEDLLRRISHSAAQEVARLAASGTALDPSAVATSLWSELLAARLVYQREDGSWGFVPGVPKLVATAPWDAVGGAEFAGWLSAALNTLQSMALSFHMSHILYGSAVQPIRDVLSDWDREQTSNLNHWLYMSEYVFRLPVTKALVTGEDPLRRDAAQAEHIAFRRAVVSLRGWAADLADGPQRLPYEVNELKLAMRLMQMRDAPEYAALVDRRTDTVLRQFVLDDDRVPEDYPAWWQTNGDVIYKWLERPEVRRALARYFSRFYRTFGQGELPAFALCADYGSYVEQLLSFWKLTTSLLFERFPSSTDLLEMHYAVDADDLRRVSAHFPRHQIVVPAGEQTGASWTMLRSAYVSLIDELGDIVKAALAERLQVGYRAPVVLWVDDNPDNNAHERDFASDLDVVFVPAETTDQALAWCEANLYDAVISDMARPPYMRAGLTLLQDLRSAGHRVPFLVYSASRGTDESAEALDWGAIGATNEASRLHKLLVDALLQTHAALDRPITELSLLAYTKRRFAELGVSEPANARALAVIDPGAFPTLLHVDRAVEAARPGLLAPPEDRARAFFTGTDFVLASLALASPDFMHRYGFDPQVLDALAELARSMSDDEADAAEDEEVDDAALLQRLWESTRVGAFADLNAEVERVLGGAVDSADWQVEAEAQMFYEADEVYASLLTWKFARTDVDMFELADRHDDSVLVHTRIRFRIEAHASFEFFVKDSIDKDMVNIGHAEASRELDMETEAQIRFSRPGPREFAVDWVEVEDISAALDFGYVEPDYGSDSPDGPDFA
jgi:hypothetical protein